MLSAGREAILVQIVHACTYVVSRIALFSTSRPRTDSGPGEVHAPCALSRYVLLLEMIVAASQVAVSLGYIPPPCSSSISYSLALLSQLSRSDQTPGLPSFLLHLGPTSFEFSCTGWCCLRESRFCLLRVLFSATLRFEEKNLLLDCSSICQLQLQHQYVFLRRSQAYSPTGSYLSILSGRWVRGRRKVMKKPVRAIDMRRTATVLDFAVGGFSKAVACQLGIFDRTFLRHFV
jgi:hypothetical protein